MASPYTKGALNAAKRLGDVFAIDDVRVGSASYAAASTTDVITHGLSTTPDFVIQTAAGVTGRVTPITWAANSTAVTFTRPGSTAAEAYSYIIGNLA